MNYRLITPVLLLTALLWFGPGAASAAPTVTVLPADGARFLVDQRFDLRIEASPAAGAVRNVELRVDGQPVAFTSNDTRDGVSGFNRRGFFLDKPGMHVVEVKATDDSGTTTTTARIEAIRGNGGKRPIKNIILCLGDGMGTAHRTAARIVRYGLNGGRPRGFLAMDRFPATGMVTTSSLNAVITDSAPGMACYSTGNHANNGQEGVYPARLSDPFSFPRVEYLAAYLHRKRGTSLGVVTTADIEDATPAATAVHTGDRGAGTGICDQFLDERERSGLAVLMGGGRRWFLPQTGADGSPVFGSSRTQKGDYGPLPSDLIDAWKIAPGTIDPNRDLLNDFKTAGFAYVATATELNRTMQGAVPDKLLGLFAYGNMNTALDKIAKRRRPTVRGVVDDYRAPDQPMLDEMADAAIKVLSKNRNGFFLLVEGAHIDKQSHLMDADRVIGDTLEFDRAVQVCRDFAERNADTVVIVVADHECSGFSVIGTLDTTSEQTRNAASDAGQVKPEDRPVRQTLINQDAFPAYEILADGYPATFDPPRKLLIGFGSNADRFENWLSKPRPVIDSALPADLKKELASLGYAATPVDREEKETGFFVRGQIGRGSADHTADDIPISAFSRNEAVRNLFVGVQENTDVFFKLMRAALGGY
ncbi:MAG: alkaline phosphatase [Capsulimonadales bacterium]|nr:alkaline phosphatase [Capsulimonadales bacterium]